MRCRFLGFGHCLILVGMVLSCPSRADDSDDTLRYYLSKADLCVAGTIASEPVAEITEEGAPHYICDIDVSQVLAGQLAESTVASEKGNAPEKTTPAQRKISVDIRRFETVAADKLPYLKKGGKCILFLKARKDAVPQWETADFWYGCQQYSPRLASALVRVAKLKAPRPADPTDKAAAPDLAGNWLLTLPLGAQHKAVIKPVGEKRFFLQKAARFSGVYELREGRLVMFKPIDAAEVGFQWELRGLDEIVLVAERKELGNDYIGAKLERQDEVPAGDDGTKPKAEPPHTPPKDRGGDNAPPKDKPRDAGAKPTPEDGASSPEASSQPAQSAPGAAPKDPTEEEKKFAKALERIKADYRLRKEPVYQARVQYCLLLLGREAKTRLWLASDGVTLYVDRNGNGDITEPDEAVPFKPEGFAAFFGDPFPGRGGEKFPKLHIAVRQRDWEKNTGGYFAVRADVGEAFHMYAFAHKFTDKPLDAPVVHLGGPLRMGLYELASGTLTPGEKTDLAALVACHYPGVEKSYVDVDVRSPSDVCPVAVVRLPAATAGAQPIILRVPLKQRC